MHIQPIILGSTLLMLAGCQTIGGESMPTLTRTGEVKDVIISEGVEPASMLVNPGDEIRWINKRRNTIQVIFLKPMTENLACQRNFGGPMGFGTKRNEYTARIRANKTASVCFREAGEVNYVIRAESSDHSGGQNMAGTISVGPMYAARRMEGHPAQKTVLPTADNADDAAMSSRLSAADRRLADELSVIQGQHADPDADLAGASSQPEKRLAAESEKDTLIAEMSVRLAAADKDRRRLLDELAAAHAQLADLDANLARLHRQLDQNRSTLASAEEDLLKALQPEISKGTVVVQHSGNALAIHLASSLLFDSGQDRMKSAATDTLKRVGTVLKEFPEKQVHVVGYSDNVAITGALQRKFPSNQKLSEARANNAAEALRNGGVSANLWADGYGDSNPIASNMTSAGRAKNRRVEILITS